MPSAAPPTLSHRDRQRLETRERVFDAAIEVIATAGLDGADVRTIIERVGVARGTFYFHFPTKQHVLIELQEREQDRMVGSLRRSRVADDGLARTVRAVVAEVLDSERRLGAGLFRDMVSVNIGRADSAREQVAGNSVLAYLVDVATTAQADGTMRGDTDPVEVAAIALTGLFGLLAATSGPSAERDRLADRYVDTILHGVLVT